MSTTVPPVAPLAYEATDIYLRLKVEPREQKGNVPDAVCTFWYSMDGKEWHHMTANGSTSKGEAVFVAAPGKWIGAKFGFFCNRLAQKNDSGWMQVDWIKVVD